MKKILFLAATAATIAACGGGHSGQPSPASTPAMDSAMTQVHDSGTPDSTVSDTTP
jgi:hypothetical protein